MSKPKLDPRYTPEEHRAAYQGRLRDLRRMGLRLPPGAVIDESESIYEGDPDALRLARLEDEDAELKSIERDDEAEQRRLH